MTTFRNLLAIILLTAAWAVGAPLASPSATPAPAGFGGGNFGGQPGPAPAHLPQLARPKLTLAGVTYSCGSVTPNLDLFLPAAGCQGWDIPINANSSFLDLALSGQVDIPGVSVTGTVKAQTVNAIIGYQIGGSYGTAGFLLCSTGAGTSFCDPAQVAQVGGFAPLASPAFTGNPTAPTPVVGDNSGSLATTAFVKSQGYLSAAPVTSVFGRAGGVLPQAGDYSVSQITGAAALNGPTFQGTVTVPTLVLSGVSGLTQCLQVNSAGLVSGTGVACGSGSGTGAVSSVFGRIGAVVASTGDYSVSQITGAAPVVSPNFTGSPTTPTVGTGDNSTSIANTAWVRLQGYITGAPVASVFGRIGAVTAQTGDYSVAQVTGAAPIASPTFTGSTTIPTLTLSGVTGLTQCLHVDSSGLVSGTGTDCGAGGGGGGNVTGSGLTTNALLVGSGGSAVAALGSLGTSTTVLIGNASGLPSWGAVNLSTMVTGVASTGNLPFTYTGSTAVLVTAGSFTGATGAGVCKDASGNLTTAGCSFGTVSSVFGRTGVVIAQSGDYSVGQITGAAPLLSPVFTGTPTSPNPPSGDNSNTLATTAFVKGQNYLTVAPVTSVFTRVGAVTAQNGDYTVSQITGAAPLASPTLTGTVTLPAPIFNNITGSLQCLHVSSSGQVSGAGADCGVGGGGGVTSVGLSLPGIFSVSGSPVTASGTLAATLNTQASNQVFAGPASGAATIPTFRALVANDLPSLSALNGALALSQTPLTTMGDLLYAGTGPALARLAGSVSSTKRFLIQTGTGSVSAAPAWGAILGADLPNPSASTLGGVQSIAAATHQFLTSISTSGVPSSSQPGFADISGTVAVAQVGLSTLGDTMYVGAGPALARLPGSVSSTRKFMTQTGTGSVSAAPVWNSIAAADLPSAVVFTNVAPTFTVPVTIASAATGSPALVVSAPGGTLNDVADFQVNGVTQVSMDLNGKLNVETPLNGAAQLNFNPITPTTTVAGDLWFTGTVFSYSDQNSVVQTFAALATNNVFTQPVAIVAPNGATTPFVLKAGAASPTADLMQVRDFGDNPIVRVDGSGNVVAPGFITNSLANGRFEWTAQNCDPAVGCVGQPAVLVDAASIRWEAPNTLTSVWRATLPPGPGTTGQFLGLSNSCPADTNGTAKCAMGWITPVLSSANLVAANKTATKSFTITDWTDTSGSGKQQFEEGRAIHITRVYCTVNGATSMTINLDARAEASANTDSGAHLLGSDLVCLGTGAHTSTFANGAAQCGGTSSCAIPLHTNVALTESAQSGGAGGDVARVTVEYTVD